MINEETIRNDVRNAFSWLRRCQDLSDIILSEGDLDEARLYYTCGEVDTCMTVARKILLDLEHDLDASIAEDEAARKRWEEKHDIG